MKEPDEQYAYFTITGSFDPVEITTRVGVAPTECWREGEISPHSCKHYKFSRWSLHARLGRDVELEAQIRDVLAQLDVNREAFRSVAREFGGRMQLAGHFETGYPSLHFESDLVEALASFSLSVGFDFYFYHDDSSSDS